MIMPNTPDRIEPLLTDLAEGAADKREEASETIVDWMSTITPDEASRLGRALAVAAVDEKATTAKEAELNALSELTSYGLLTRDDVLPLSAMPRPVPGVTGREHLDYLNDEFGLWPE